MRRIFIFHFFAGQSERAASAHFTEVGRRYRRVLDLRALRRTTYVLRFLTTLKRRVPLIAIKSRQIVAPRLAFTKMGKIIK